MKKVASGTIWEPTKMKHLHDGNYHHAIWQRASYKTSSEKRFRTHAGLIVPMRVPAHNELHYRLDPPPKPSTEQILGALSFMDSLEQDELNCPPVAVELLSGHFMEQNSNLAKRVGKHLLRQLWHINRA